MGLAMMVGRGGLGRLAAELAEVGPEDHVFDIGCGPGSAAREAAGRGATVTGVDPASVMLSIARRFTRGGSRISWLEGTAESVPVADGAGTVLWSIATVHHWKDVDTGLAEAHRVLAPGGRLVAIERRTKAGARGLASHGWTEAQAERFAELCTAHGFDDARVQTRGKGRRRQLVVTATRGHSPGSPR